MQPGAKESRAGVNRRGYSTRSDLRTLLRARHLAVDALTNDRRRRCDGIADHRIVDVEAKRARVGCIVQPQRDRIALNPVQVQPGRLEIQAPATASAVRFRDRNDSHRNSSRSFIDRVQAEEGPIALIVNRMRDEWVDYVVKRKALKGRTVIVAIAFVKIRLATLAQQRDFDARSDGIFLSVVATAVAVAKIGESEIESGRVGIAAGVNDLNSLLPKSDFARLFSPRRLRRQRRQAQRRRTQHSYQKTSYR